MYPLTMLLRGYDRSSTEINQWIDLHNSLTRSAYAREDPQINSMVAIAANTCCMQLSACSTLLRNELGSVKWHEHGREEERRVDELRMGRPTRMSCLTANSGRIPEVPV
jgi:hypothetical protein